MFDYKNEDPTLIVLDLTFSLNKKKNDTSKNGCTHNKMIISYTENTGVPDDFTNLVDYLATSNSFR